MGLTFQFFFKIKTSVLRDITRTRDSGRQSACSVTKRVVSFRARPKFSVQVYWWDDDYFTYYMCTLCQSAYSDWMGWDGTHHMHPRTHVSGLWVIEWICNGCLKKFYNHTHAHVHLDENPHTLHHHTPHDSECV